MDRVYLRRGQEVACTVLCCTVQEVACTVPQGESRQELCPGCQESGEERELLQLSSVCALEAAQLNLTHLT